MSTTTRRTLVAALAAAPLLAAAAPSVAASGRTTYVLVPHQDDEMSRLAHYLIMAALRGDRVVLIQVTDGAATGVRHRLGLTPGQTTAIRDLEQKAALGFLTGGRGEIVRLGLPDGGANWRDVLAGAKKVIGAPAAGKEVYVATWHHDHAESVQPDKHPDHAACVLAARQLAKEGHVVRYGRHPSSKVTRGTSYFVRDAEQTARLRGAIESYRPIGWVSAPATFSLIATTRNRITS